MSEPMQVHEVYYTAVETNSQTISGGPSESNIFHTLEVTGNIKLRFDRVHAVGDPKFRAEIDDDVYRRLDSIYELQAIVPKIFFICGDKSVEFKNLKLRCRTRESHDNPYTIFGYNADEIKIGARVR